MAVEGVTTLCPDVPALPDPAPALSDGLPDTSRATAAAGTPRAGTYVTCRINPSNSAWRLIIREVLFNLFFPYCS